MYLFSDSLAAPLEEPLLPELFLLKLSRPGPVSIRTRARSLNFNFACNTSSGRLMSPPEESPSFNHPRTRFGFLKLTVTPSEVLGIYECVALSEHK